MNASIPPAANTRASRMWLLGVAVVVLIVTVVLVMPPKSSTPPVIPSIVQPASTKALLRDEAQVFATYSGSASCAACHKDEHANWKTSHHGLAERELDPARDKSAFDPPRAIQHGTQHTDVSFAGGQFRLAALDKDERYTPLAAARVIGEAPLRQYLVNFPDGRLQALEAAYDPQRNEWFNVYGGEDRRPGEWGHWSGRGMNWNSQCAACHNTRLRKNYNEATDSYATHMTEPTVSCEACHRPMKAHVVWRQANPNPKGAEPNYKRLDPEQVFETCAQCHSRRMELTGDFAPGDPFHEHYSLSIVDGSDMFYPDGQVRDEDYEYSAFLGSRMHAAGVRCNNCHDPHTAKVRLPGNALCMQCHTGKTLNAPVIDPAKHAFHKLDPLYAANAAGADLIALAKRAPEEVARSGGECINCHMPQTNYMQRHSRHDHGFTTPDPLLTQRFGIPNACNRCHTDKDTAWAVTWSSAFYGEKMNRPSRQRTTTLAAARRGDASAREGLLALLSGKETPYWIAAGARLSEHWLSDPQVNAALLYLTEHSAPLVREGAVQALASSAKVPEVESVLRKRLDDPARSVRFHAEWALRSSLEPASAGGSELLQILNYLADQPAGQMQKGAYFAARNDAGQALHHYGKAVSWDPTSAALRHDYAVMLSSFSRPAEAVTQLEQACKLEPREAEYRYKLALAYNEVNEMAKAIAALRETVKLEPAHAHAWYNLGLALNAQGQKDEALDALMKAEAADAHDPRNPYARATILVQSGHPEEAREAAARALQIQPSFAPALELLKALR